MNNNKDDWDKSYDNRDNFVFYPHEEVIRFVSKFIRKKIGLTDFLQSTPQGFQHRIEPQGSNLSKSVAQLILIARSVCKNAKLLLLEDALEHLDDGPRRRVVDFITDKNRPWTLICVSSDAYLASKCDQIILLDQGSISAQGEYKLMKSSITFKKEGHA